jgi:hypothetical protein
MKTRETMKLALLVLGTIAATQAVAAVDPQEVARQMIAPPITYSGNAAGDVISAAPVDSQLQAQRLIRGLNASHLADAQSAQRSRHHGGSGYSDPHARARAQILCLPS